MEFALLASCGRSAMEGEFALLASCGRSAMEGEFTKHSSSKMGVEAGLQRGEPGELSCGLQR